MSGAWDPVPWVVGGGALHSVNVFRNVAFAAFGGREGISTPTACEVRELTVPGNKVRVFPGTVSIKNRAAGVIDEMYAGRLPVVDDTVAITPTGLSARSDLIVVRVENPFDESAGWPAPADPQTGPYIFTRVIENVPNTTTRASDLGLGESMIALARIDMPASTGTVLQAYITDLRQMNSSFVSPDSRIIQPEAASTLTSAAYVNWIPEANVDFQVPEWATHARVRVLLAGIYAGGATTTNWSANGHIRIQLGPDTAPLFGPTTGYQIDLPTPSGSGYFMFMAGADALELPVSSRGNTIGFKLQGNKTSGNTSLVTNTWSTVSVDIDFLNKPMSNA
jgi:hypothetical protein